jgi:allophanate hydrolase subunit 1
LHISGYILAVSKDTTEISSSNLKSKREKKKLLRIVFLFHSNVKPMEYFQKVPRITIPNFISKIEDKKYEMFMSGEYYSGLCWMGIIVHALINIGQ